MTPPAGRAAALVAALGLAPHPEGGWYREIFRSNERVARRDGTRPVHTVPAGWWQAARTAGEYTWVGCTVGPGFEFADFALLDDRPDEARILRERFADVRAIG